MNNDEQKAFEKLFGLNMRLALENQRLKEALAQSQDTVETLACGQWEIGHERTHKPEAQP